MIPLMSMCNTDWCMILLYCLYLTTKRLDEYNNIMTGKYILL